MKISIRPGKSKFSDCMIYGGSDGYGRYYLLLSHVSVGENQKRMMSYPNQLKNDYRIAKVLQVFPDDKNLVRTFRVT